MRSLKKVSDIDAMLTEAAIASGMPSVEYEFCPPLFLKVAQTREKFGE